MAKNPKIEFFIININSYKKEKPTFRDLFTELYSIKKSKNTRDNIDNSILMNMFLIKSVVSIRLIIKRRKLFILRKKKRRI